MFRFLFNPMRTPKPLAAVVLLALGLALPFSAGAKKKKVETGSRAGGGPAQIFVRPQSSGLAQPAQHRARTLARLLRGEQDRLRARRQQPSPRQAGWTVLPEGSRRAKR